MSGQASVKPLSASTTPAESQTASTTPSWAAKPGNRLTQFMNELKANVDRVHQASLARHKDKYPFTAQPSGPKSERLHRFREHLKADVD